MLHTHCTLLTRKAFSLLVYMRLPRCWGFKGKHYQVSRNCMYAHAVDTVLKATQVCSVLRLPSPSSLSLTQCMVRGARCVQNPLPTFDFLSRPSALLHLLLFPSPTAEDHAIFLMHSLAYVVDRGLFDFSFLFSSYVCGQVFSGLGPLAPLRHTWFGPVVLPRCLGPVFPTRKPLLLRKRLVLCMP